MRRRPPPSRAQILYQPLSPAEIDPGQMRGRPRGWRWPPRLTASQYYATFGTPADPSAERKTVLLRKYSALQRGRPFLSVRRSLAIWIFFQQLLVRLQSLLLHVQVLEADRRFVDRAGLPFLDRFWGGRISIAVCDFEVVADGLAIILLAEQNFAHHETSPGADLSVGR